METTVSNSSGPGRSPPREITATATTSVITERTTLAPTISKRRSWRSVKTPAGSANSNHGRRCTTATRAISTGLRVIADASHG